MLILALAEPGQQILCRKMHLRVECGGSVVLFLRWDTRDGALIAASRSACSNEEPRASFPQSKMARAR